MIRDCPFCGDALRGRGAERRCRQCGRTPDAAALEASGYLAYHAARAADVALPGLDAIRDQEHPLPPVADVPRADPNAFDLTPPTETAPGQTRLDFRQE